MSSHAPADRLTIARSLREIGLLLGVKGENRFRAQAYERGAEALETLRGDLEALLREHALTKTPGIGPALAAEIATLHRTGRSPLLERLRSELPPGILELLRVPGLGVQRIAELHRALGIRSLEALRIACETGRVRKVRGFGPVSERKLLEGIRALASARPVLLLHQALREAEPLLEHLRRSPAVLRAESAGALRRGVETAEGIELVLATERPAQVAQALSAWPRTARVLEQDGEHCLAELAGGATVALALAEPGSFPAVWQRLTGSPAHVAKLLAIPQQHASEADGEEAVYLSRGLPWIPPELREDEGEIEAARGGTLPTDLVALEDLRGFVHCHTNHSDGRATIEEMARAAERLGAEYVTITDHSPAAFYAGGLSLERLRAQWDEIDRVQEQVGITLLRGTEADILADGAIDYPDEVLARLDVVIASIHGRHKLDPEQMTRRLVRAMRHPLFKVWGHALGRVIGQRPEIACDVPRVLDAVAESRAAIEINGDPHRLDLPPRWIREARRRGIRFVISTDAHAAAELRNARYGVTAARRGWVRRGEVLNALPLGRFREAVRPSGSAAG